MRNSMGRAVALSVGALLVWIALAGAEEPKFEGNTNPKVDVEMQYSGKVTVKKEGETVKSIAIAIDEKTSYFVKLNPNGLKVAPFDGKVVVVRAVLRKTESGLLLTVRDVKELQPDGGKAGDKPEGKAEGNKAGGGGGDEGKSAPARF